MKDEKQIQYLGFLNTPNLWNGSIVEDLQQFKMPSENYNLNNTEDFNEVRLGKRVEQFFNHQIENSLEFDCIATNLQIKDEKITIGELDALIQSENQIFHIEIIYKFYLHNPNIESENELDKWIGPNQKDTFVYKLEKLKNKQLPLLYSKYTEAVLNEFSLKSENFNQRLCYKAQLFLPFEDELKSIKPLNKSSIYGFYLGFDDIEKLSAYKIYIPNKLDWLITPILDVNWFNFEVGKAEIFKFINQKRSPMVWLKSEDDSLIKCFITFW